MAAHPQNDGRPGGRQEGGPETEGNDQGAVPGERPAVAGDGGPAEQGGQQPEGDTGTKADHRDRHGELPIASGFDARRLGHVLRNATGPALGVRRILIYVWAIFPEPLGPSSYCLRPLSEVCLSWNGWIQLARFSMARSDSCPYRRPFA